MPCMNFTSELVQQPPLRGGFTTQNNNRAAFVYRVNTVREKRIYVYSDRVSWDYFKSSAATSGLITASSRKHEFRKIWTAKS